MKALPLETGKEFWNTSLDLIKAAGANDEIIANYFVVRSDRAGLEFLRHLYQAAWRGAKVKLILDSYGSLHPAGAGTEYSGAPLRAETIRSLKDMGVEVHIYHHIESVDKFAVSNIKNWERYSRRNHNKNLVFNLKSMGMRGIVLGDSQWANEHFNGQMRGHNLAIFDENLYLDAITYTRNLLRSNSVEMYRFGELDWRMVDAAEEYFNQPTEFDLESWSWFKEENLVPVDKCEFVASEVEFVCPKLRHSIQKYEVELIKSAQRELWYCTPYFAPDSELRESLLQAAHVLQNHDILIGKFRHDPYLPYGVKKAAQKMLRKHARIHEYTGVGNIHYKDMLVDDKVFVKTANGEGRSRFYNLDTGVIIHSAQLAAIMKQRLEKERESYQQLDAKTNYLNGHSLWARPHRLLLRPFYYHHL